MPRQPDPDLEDRIMKAAQALWKRGGDGALTMRAVARAAGSNTPAVYRRFKNRQVLIQGLLRRIVAEIREPLALAQSIEDFAEVYVEYALQRPHEYELFYSQVRWLSPPKGSGAARPIRESRPNFGLAEEILARQLGGAPGQHTRLALEVWALLHGTVTLLLSKAIPEGHGEELRRACLAAVKTLVRASEPRSTSRKF